MMNVSTYCAELMKQDFSDSVGNNYIKLGIMIFLKNNNYVIKKISVDNLFCFIFRFLIDNRDISSNTADVLIKNIEHYGPADLRDSFLLSLNSWIKVGSGVLCFDGENIFTSKELLLNEADITTLNRVFDMICIKNIKRKINYLDSLNDEADVIKDYLNDFSLYMEFMNNSKYRNRAFEEIDYCCCCESVYKKELVPIHLDRFADLEDPNNLVVMCKDHAYLYFYEYFKFNKTGKIVIIKSSDLLDKRMHLSVKFLTNNRKRYLID